MDPNAIISEGWVESINDPTDNRSTADNTYAYVRRYANGRVVTEFYRRGEEGIKNTTTTTNPEQKKAYDASLPQQISAPPNQATIVSQDPQTGALTTQPNPNYTPPSTATTPAEPPKTEDRGGRHYVWVPNPGGPQAGGQWKDVGPSEQTHTYQVGTVERNGRRYTQITAAPKDGSGPPTVSYLDESGQSITALPAPAGTSERIPVEGRPGLYTRKTVDPTTGSTRVEYVDAQDNVVPGPQPNQEIRAGVGEGGADVRVVRDPQTGQVVRYEPIPGSEGKGAFQPLPTGVPAFTPDLTQVDLGLGARRRALEELVANGTITKGQAAQAITADGETAKAAGSNAGAIINVQEGIRAADLTARGQDISEAAGRRTFAGSTFNQALSTLAPVAAQFVPGPGAGEAAARGFEAMLGLARSHAGASGGMAAPRGYDPSQYPMLAGFGQAGIPGLPGGPPLSSQWTFGPGGPVPGPAGPAGALPGRVPLPAPAATVPNAIGLGAIGNVPAPGGVPRPVPLPGPAPVAAPSAVPLPAPIFRPQPGPLPAPPMGPSPAAGLLQRSWAQSTMPNYSPSMTGLDEDLLRSGFDPDVLGLAMGGRL